MTIRRCSSCNRIRVDANQPASAKASARQGLRLVDQRYAASLAYVVEQMVDRAFGEEFCGK